jgi:hypothetical protein
VGHSCHVHSSSPLPAFDQVQGAGYSVSKLETEVAALQFETSAADLELEMDTTALELEADTIGLELKIDVPQETSKQERYSANSEWPTLKLLLMGQYQ